MPLSFVQWIQLTGFLTALRGSSYVYPIILSLHGALSLVLWTGVLCNGRLIGYYEPPQQKGHVVSAAPNSAVPK